MSMTPPVAVDALPDDIDLSSTRGGARAAQAHWFEVAAMLRDKPEQWFIVGTEASSSLPSRIREGRIAAFEEGTFEARGYKSHKSGSGKTNVYEKVFARYIGTRVPLAPAPAPAPVAPKPTSAPTPTAPAMTPMQRVALSIAKHHVDARKTVWADLPEEERRRRVEAAGVAYSTVYALIADDMENTVKAKVRNRTTGIR